MEPRSPLDAEQLSLWIALGDWMMALERRHGRPIVSIHRHYVRDYELCRTLYAQN